MIIKSSYNEILYKCIYNKKDLYAHRKTVLYTPGMLFTSPNLYFGFLYVLSFLQRKLDLPFFFRLISLSKVLHVYMFELNFCCELLWYKMYAGILTCTEGQAFVQMKGFNDSIAIICK